MKIKKEDNQYYGKYFEQAICNIINKEKIINITGFDFSTSEIEELNADAQMVADYLKADYAEYLGEHTRSSNCDLLIDGKEIELKYVSQGSGTYYNTSLNYINSELGFTSYSEYLKKHNVLFFLERTFGEKVYKNISPISNSESSFFRHKKPKSYEILQRLEKEARKEYVKDLYNFLSNNPTLLQKFINDMISKKTSNKDIPETILVFNNQTKKILTISKDTLVSFVKNKTFNYTDCGFVFDNFRVQFGWQNGTGLNNPTIRVFI